MLSNYLNKNPKLSLLCINIIFLLFIFFVGECVLRINTPFWLENRMTTFLIKNNYKADKNSDKPLKNIILTNEKNKFISYAPYSKTKLSHFEYENTINIDKYGGRKTSSEQQIFSDSTKKVLFLGDSFTFGVGVEDDEVFCSLLQKDINLKLLNFGRPGSSLARDIDLLKLLLRDFIKKNKIDKIVFCWFLGNDAADIIKIGLPKDKQTNHKKITTAVETKSESLMFKINRFIYNNKFFNRSYFIQYIRQKIINLNKYAIVMDPVFYLFLNKESYIKNFQDLTKIYLKQLRDLSDLHDIKINFLLIPDRYQIYDEKRVTVKEKYSINKNIKLDYLMPNKILISLLDEYEFEFIDPTKCLKKKAEYHKNLYYNNDNHLTKYGHKLYYECIKDELLIKFK